MAKILILSDYREMNALLELIFKREGYEYITVTTVPPALARLQILDIDLCIFVLPLTESNSDGWDFYTHLKADSILRHIPVIIHTGWLFEPCPNPTDFGDALFLRPMATGDLRAKVKEFLNRG